MVLLNKMKKVAVFHNFMDNIGGAEMVTLSFVREFDADLYTTNIDKEKIIKMGFGDILERIFSIGEVSNISPFRQQLAFFKFRKLNLSNKYDFFIISGDWAMSGAVNNHPNMWYAHSPLNELWEYKNYVKKEILNWWKKPLYDIWVYINRKLSLSYSKHVDTWVCNSENTKKRIEKYYKKNAKVIHPPIDVSDYINKPDKNYWLSVNRLTINKRIDMQIKAFSKLSNENLVIVGCYEKGTSQFESYKKYIESIKTDNIEILNWVSREKLIELYSECKGLIATARDEDFGMSVIEAMASGKPIIASNEGGYKESVINDRTGILIDSINEQKIIEAINKIESNLYSDSEKYKNNSIKQAKKFDTKEFVKSINNIIYNKV